MTDNQKFLSGLALGAAAGAAIAILLQSDRGKEMLDNIKDFASKTGDKVKDSLGGLTDEVSGLWNRGNSKTEQTAENAV
ncbi:MAG TPA: YtxH domain-containing protein [Chitinophagaceae bacterium]